MNGETMDMTDMPRRSTLVVGRCIALIALVSATFVFAAPRARAADDDAGQIVKAMSDYLASQTTISAVFDTDIEVITPELQKVQFASSGAVQLSRPDKLHATRTGGYSDVELFFDGKTFTVYGKNINSFVQVDAPGSIDKLIDLLRAKGVAVPGADLLFSNAYETLMADVIDAKHIGRGVVGGVECEHLAFRNEDTDWQLWVEVGANPIPRKFVITSKAVAAAPQYTLIIKDWKTDVPDAATFAFKPPAGATEVGLDALANLDEIPPSTPPKGQQP
jgi:hypothetical protein